MNGSRSELILFIGLPASGKSSFFQSRFAGTHEQVSKDLLPHVRNRSQRQLELIDRALRTGRSVVVDNLNATRADRAPLIILGRRHGARVVGYHFTTQLRDCLERNERREGRARVPKVAIYATAKRFEEPSYAEGFDELYRVRLTVGPEFEVSECPRIQSRFTPPEVET